jgi:hypothetical protein
VRRGWESLRVTGLTGRHDRGGLGRSGAGREERRPRPGACRQAGGVATSAGRRGNRDLEVWRCRVEARPGGAATASHPRARRRVASPSPALASRSVTAPFDCRPSCPLPSWVAAPPDWRRAGSTTFLFGGGGAVLLGGLQRRR